MWLEPPQPASPAPKATDSAATPPVMRGLQIAVTPRGRLLRSVPETFLDELAVARVAGPEHE